MGRTNCIFYSKQKLFIPFILYCRSATKENLVSVDRNSSFFNDFHTWHRLGQLRKIGNTDISINTNELLIHLIPIYFSAISLHIQHVPQLFTEWGKVAAYLSKASFSKKSCDVLYQCKLLIITVKSCVASYSNSVSMVSLKCS